MQSYLYSWHAPPARLDACLDLSPSFNFPFYPHTEQLHTNTHGDDNCHQWINDSCRGEESTFPNSHQHSKAQMHQTLFVCQQTWRLKEKEKKKALPKKFHGFLPLMHSHWFRQNSHGKFAKCSLISTNCHERLTAYWKCRKKHREAVMCLLL